MYSINFFGSSLLLGLHFVKLMKTKLLLNLINTCRICHKMKSRGIKKKIGGKRLNQFSCTWGQVWLGIAHIPL